MNAWPCKAWPRKTAVNKHNNDKNILKYFIDVWLPVEVGSESLYSAQTREELALLQVKGHSSIRGSVGEGDDLRAASVWDAGAQMTDADAAVAAVQVELLTKNRTSVTSDRSLHTCTLHL